jgi:hypothetical protein
MKPNGEILFYQAGPQDAVKGLKDKFGAAASSEM